MREEVIVVEPSSSFPVINEELCTGCGLCVKRCPRDAIRVINLPGESGRPTFQYGANTFRVYGMILPKQGAVVGIVGVNGIGKTTALKMLAGALKPNFGHFNREPSWEEIRKEFRGQEIQAFLEKLASKQVRVAYKMQYVDELAKGRGTARQLLEACDEKNEAPQAIESFELSSFLDRSLSSLSGGELQRLAIACTMLRNANAYVFDEPSSYLDIRQRLKVAARIRELSAKAAVVVVEHDLAVLDYLSDYVHVLYGSKGVYGVVSSLKSAKNGVNEYLDGFLRDENVRFRVNSIKFEAVKPQSQKPSVIYSYSSLRKSFHGNQSFSLEVEGGGVGKGEVIAVVGPNAIGKSTFVKLLAGVEEADEGSGFSEKVSIAFKPQHPYSEFGGSVRELFAAQKDLNKELFDAEVREGLEISELFDKPVKSLSGGELQRVSIALCLCKDAGVRLIDEPSAFLDVEQRLRAASLIKKVAEATGVPCFVVEHDVLFVDKTANRVIVFEGSPGVRGKALAPVGLKEGMTALLKQMNVTFRRDALTGRPRANKPGSALDREQREAGEYYYYEARG
jgi:ATP-binding cassette subfamily E protein 1